MKINAHMGHTVTAADLYAPGCPHVERPAAPPVETADTTRGFAVTKNQPPAHPLTDLQGKHPTKVCDLPPLHMGARGRDTTNDPHFKPQAKYNPGMSDALLTEAIGDRHLPGAKHHSHSDNMRKR